MVPYAGVRYHFYMPRFLQDFEAARPFTEAEAWLLFRIAAVAEACGWTLLISGILIDKYITMHSNTAVLLAGQTHGMLFLTYCVASLGLYPSLGWSRWRGVTALLFSIPPYGTLVFEQWVAIKRHNAGFKTYRHFLVYNRIAVEANHFYYPDV
jgi:integral membrane protein